MNWRDQASIASACLKGAQKATTSRQVLFLLGLSGEPCRIRTCDPLIKSQLLYQLS